MKLLRIVPTISLFSPWLHVAQAAGLLPYLYNRFPVGAVRPSGWALDQAKVQANGLAGNMWDFYSYVKGSIWVGGAMEYSEMHEAAPYWFNGAVALAFQLEDERLIGQVRSFLDYVLNNQQEDGWLGPELPTNSTTPRLTWPRYLLLFGLVQYAEADPSQTTRIVNAMHRFVSLVHDIWAKGEEGDPSLGFQFDYQHVRWEELLYSLQWLYDNYPQGKEDELLETMKLVKESGYDWKNEFYTDAAFPKEAVPQGSTNQHTHGVNNAEAMKSEVLSYRISGDSSDIDSTFKRLDLLYGYHGRATGTYASDEHLAGLDPSRGTETCTVVEQIFSLAVIYQAFGNNSVADRVEKLAYNALPSAMTADWWSHQYDQQVNQIWAKNMTDENPYGGNSGYSNVFGMEPNYPCCTVNHPQAYPKYWANSFYSDQSGKSLIHIFLGPSTFNGTLGSNNTVSVTVDTLYPFGSTLNYTVQASEPFTFNTRIPDWAQGTNASTITINNGNTSSLALNSTTSFQAVEVDAGSTSIVLDLHMPLSVETVSNGAVVVNRGPLNYAVEIKLNDTATPAWRGPQALADVRRLFPDTPEEYLTPYDNHTQDHTFLPTSEWRLAIDPATIVVHDTSADLDSIASPPWELSTQPVTMTASACQIAWGVVKNAAAAPPASPAACEGDKFNVTLAPFGAVKLRLGEIPTMKV